jgi:hypothetical protein
VKKAIYNFFSLGLIILLLTACISVTTGNPFTPTPVKVSAPTLQQKPTNTTAPPTLMPTANHLTETPQPNGMDRTNIYLIAVGDNGMAGKKIGCGDSVIPVVVAIQPTTGVLRAALTELFGLEGQSYYGQSGLYNALYLSHLTIDNLNIINRKAIINLKGTLKIAGDCDDPRIKAQLEEIALQFNTIDQVSVFINGISLDQLLSGRG